MWCTWSGWGRYGGGFKDTVRPNGRSAIVTDNGRFYGLSRMFETYAEMAPDLPLVLPVFRTIEEAKHWLFDGG